jgi:hypothetical protein
MARGWCPDSEGETSGTPYFSLSARHGEREGPTPQVREGEVGLGKRSGISDAPNARRGGRPSGADPLHPAKDHAGRRGTAAEGLLYTQIPQRSDARIARCLI